MSFIPSPFRGPMKAMAKAGSWIRNRSVRVPVPSAQTLSPHGLKIY